MATPTYIALANLTLTGTAANVVFSNLPNTYRDFVVVAMANKASTANYFRIYLNGDTGANYSRVAMFFEGSVGSSTANNSSSGVIPSTTTSQYGFNMWHFMDANATDKHKTIIGRQGATNPSVIYADAIRWANTAAVTSIELDVFSGDFASGSTFALYGIEA